MANSLEEDIARLTRPINGQYPRPWMTNLANPSAARVFIVGRNQRNGFPVELVGPHRRYLDALFNRNGESCRALYNEVTGGRPSKTRTNSDFLVRSLAGLGVTHILETNVICYSTPSVTG